MLPKLKVTMKGYEPTGQPLHSDNLRSVIMVALSDARDAGCGSLGEIADVIIAYMIKTLHLDPAYYHRIQASTGAVKSILENKPELRTATTGQSKPLPKKKAEAEKPKRKLKIKRKVDKFDRILEEGI